jgi:hypothetical protein
VIGQQTEHERGTSRVCAFAPNGYGLCDMTGNVWQWVADWYRADAFALVAQNREPVDPKGPGDSYDPDETGAPVEAPKRVIRGGSFLYSQSYCLSYRPSARRGSDPYTSMSHMGFRLVANPTYWVCLMWMNGALTLIVLISAGRDSWCFTTPVDVISNLPNPKIKAWSDPPAPVAK